MTEDKILTKEEVLRGGVCFEDELDWGGECYEQIVCENELGEEVPYTGLAYDLYPDGQLEFYGYIDNGYRHGLAVYFYSSGKIKSINNQDRGSAEGIQKEYFENGDIESVSYCIAGEELLYKKYDETGKVIEEKTEPTEDDFKRAKKWGVDLSTLDLNLQ